MSSLKTISAFAIVLSTCISSALWAKPINLYDQPKPDAKVIGALDSSKSLVPIISSKDGSWMKVGDPENGNVGWIKVSDVTTNGANTSAGFTMTEKTVNSTNGPQTVRTIQFGTPTNLTPEQTQARIGDISQRQAEVEKATTQLMQHLFDNMNAVYQANPAFYNNLRYPMIVPVMVVPAPATSIPQSPPVAPMPAKPR